MTPLMTQFMTSRTLIWDGLGISISQFLDITNEPTGWKLQRNWLKIVNSSSKGSESKLAANFGQRIVHDTKSTTMSFLIANFKTEILSLDWFSIFTYKNVFSAQGFTINIIICFKDQHNRNYLVWHVYRCYNCFKTVDSLILIIFVAEISSR